MEEAENFVRGTAAAAGGNGAENGEETIQPDEDTAVAYVDGSYNVATGEYSCGVVFLYEGRRDNGTKRRRRRTGADAECGWRDPGIAACDGTCCQTGDSEDKNFIMIIRESLRGAWGMEDKQRGNESL